MSYLGTKPANSPLTSELIPDGIIATSDIANGAVTVSKISATGTPSASNFLRGDGSWQVAGGDPTTAQVLSATAGYTSNVVGSFCVTNRSTAGPIALNGTVAGSSLYGIDGSGSSVFPMTGTWKNLGCSQIASAGYTAGNTILVRIA